MEDYCERSVFEALVNALIHRDYLINGSEVHVEMDIKSFSPTNLKYMRYFYEMYADAGEIRQQLVDESGSKGIGQEQCF